MYRRLRQENEQLKSRVLRFTQELIQTPSTSLNETRVADRVQGLMGGLGYDLVLRDDAGNVVGAMLESSQDPTILLSSHMDTVEPARSQRAGYAPFSGRIEGGRIYGLGASDCKGGLAAQIFAGHLLAAGIFPRQGNIVVAATVAEASGSSVGARYLLEHTLPRLGMEPTFAVLGAPTQLDLCYWNDTWVTLEVRVRGSDRAMTRRAAIVIYDLFCRDHRRAEHHGQHGRQAFPDRCSASEATFGLYCQLPPGHTVEECVRLVGQRAAAAVKPLGAVDVEIRAAGGQQRSPTEKTANAVEQTPPSFANLFELLVDRAREALVESGWGKVDVKAGRSELLRTGAAGDLLVNHYRIPTVAFGPGDRDHAPDESVEVERIVDAVFGTAVLTHGLTTVPLFPLHSEMDYLLPRRDA